MEDGERVTCGGVNSRISADCHCNVLGTAGGERDGRGVDTSSELKVPQQSPRVGCERVYKARTLSHEDQAPRGRKRAAERASRKAVLPQDRPARQIDRGHEAVTGASIGEVGSGVSSPMMPPAVTFAEMVADDDRCIEPPLHGNNRPGRPAAAPRLLGRRQRFTGGCIGRDRVADQRSSIAVDPVLALRRA